MAVTKRTTGFCVLFFIATTLHAEPAIEVVYAGSEPNLFGSHCFGMRFKNKTGRPIAVNAYRAVFYFLDSSGQPFYEDSKAVPEMKANYVASVQICDSNGNLVDWDKKSFRVSFIEIRPVDMSGQWVLRAVKQGDTLQQFINGSDRNGSDRECQQVIDYNVRNFDKIKGLPGNAGLAAENLAKCKCDSVFTKPRTLLVPQQ